MTHFILIFPFLQLCGTECTISLRSAGSNLSIGEHYWASLIAWFVKNPPAMQETPVQFLGQEDPLEKGWATHSVFFGFPVAWLVNNPPAIRETWVPSLGWEDPLEKGMATTPVFWPGEFHGLCIVHGVAESQYTTEQPSLSLSLLDNRKLLQIPPLT